MPDILVDDIDERDVEVLRDRAERNNRSLEDEVRAILEAVVEDQKKRRSVPDLSTLQARLARGPSSDSTEIVRAMRDAQ